MSLLDKLLEPTGKTYEQLNPAERETLNSMVEVLRKSQLTVDKIREKLGELLRAVEQEIAKEPSFKRIFIFKVENPKLIRLQARLANYLLLEAFLSTPEAAQAQLDQAIANLKASA